MKMTLWRLRSVPWPSVLGVAALLGMAGTVLWLRPVALSVGAEAPDIAGSKWFNRAPTTLRQLRGSVVLIEFFAFG